MSKFKRDSISNESEIIKEYQSVVRKLQSEVYSLKNSQAVQDEIFKSMQKTEFELKSELVTHKQQTLKSQLAYTKDELSAKTELITNNKLEKSHLYEEINKYKQKNFQLLNEIESYREALSSDSLCEIQPNIKDFTEKVEAVCTLRKAAESNAEFFKEELSKKIEEVEELKTELGKAREESKNGLRKDELKKMIILKDEQMKNLNKKFQVMTGKIDSLTKERDQLESDKKLLESEKKRLSERWHQSSNRNRSEGKLLSKAKKLDTELSICKSELENSIKKSQELYQKHQILQQSKDSDLAYIEKLKEELLKQSTKYEILSDERDILARINQELSVNIHLKDLQLSSIKSVAKPSDDYQFAVEMNVSLEHKLERCESEIFALRSQLNQKSEDLARLGFELSSIKEGCCSKDATQDLHSECSPSELNELIEDFKQLLEKYKKCKVKKNDAIEGYQKMKEKIIGLSTQVQSDQYLIRHLQDKLKLADGKSLAESRSVSSLKIKS